MSLGHCQCAWELPSATVAEFIGDTGHQLFVLYTMQKKGGSTPLGDWLNNSGIAIPWNIVQL